MPSVLCGRDPSGPVRLLYSVNNPYARAPDACFWKRNRSMALRLTIISEQAAELGEQASVVIDKGGGTIGRAGDNVWVLPDRLRYISSHHARISFRNGGFIVEDTSTNGLFLNDEDEPVGRLGPQPLRPGDRLRLGAYMIAVRDNEAATAEDSALVRYRASQGGRDPQGLPGDHGVNLNIRRLP